MDVSVSHLNNRLALQLPAQLPLGLVFVLGEIENLTGGDNDRSGQKQFELVEKEHRVRCLLSERVAPEMVLETGDTIRAGGHLTFDPTHADYYLLVRDIEIVPSQPSSMIAPDVDRAEIAMIMADVQKRAEAAKLAKGELPSWVKKMAPVAYKEEIVEVKAETPVQGNNGKELESKQLAQLSAAMDSDEDVELTSSLLEVAKKLNLVRGVQTKDGGGYGVPSPVIGAMTAYPTDVEDPEAYTPTGKRRADYILILVIIVALALFLMIFLVLYMNGF